MVEEDKKIKLENLKNEDKIVEKFNKIILFFEKFVRVSQETFSEEEAAEYLRVDRRTIRYYAKRMRELPYAKIGRKLIFTKRDLDRFLERKKMSGVLG